MSRWAHVVGGVVDNVSMWDGDPQTWTPPDLAHMVELADDSPVGIGWTYDGTTFIEPVAPPPVVPEDQPLVVTDPTAFTQAVADLAAAKTTAAKLDALTRAFQHLQP